MATSPETFNQVRNLLRKMDQSIDQARGKRLAGDTHPPAQPLPAPQASAAGPQTLIGAPAPKPAMNAPQQSSSVSSAQRARPLAARMEGPSRFGQQQPPHSKAG